MNQRDRQSFIKKILAYCAENHAVPGTGFREGWQSILTVAGWLHIQPESCPKSKTVCCFAAFDFPRLAFQFVQCNNCSGKWNFHFPHTSSSHYAVNCVINSINAIKLSGTAKLAFDSLAIPVPSLVNEVIEDRNINLADPAYVQIDRLNHVGAVDWFTKYAQTRLLFQFASDAVVRTILTEENEGVDLFAKSQISLWLTSYLNKPTDFRNAYPLI